MKLNEGIKELFITILKLFYKSKIVPKFNFNDLKNVGNIKSAQETI